MMADTKKHIEFLDSLNLRYILFSGNKVLHSNKYRFKNVKNIDDLSSFKQKWFHKNKKSILDKSEININDVDIKIPTTIYL